MDVGKGIVVDRENYTITYHGLIDSDTGETLVHELTREEVLDAGFRAIEDDVRRASEEGAAASRRLQAMAQQTMAEEMDTEDAE